MTLKADISQSAPFLGRKGELVAEFAKRITTGSKEKIFTLKAPGTFDVLRAIKTKRGFNMRGNWAGRKFSYKDWDTRDSEEIRAHLAETAASAQAKKEFGISPE